MNQLLEKYLKKYPELTDMLTSTLFIPKSLYYRYQTDDFIVCNDVEMSELFLIDILVSSYYYPYVEKLFNGETNELKIGYENDGELSVESLSKADIIAALDVLFKESKFNIPEDVKKRYELLKEKISYSRLKQEKINEVYTVDIDRQTYNVSINDILLFMQMKTEKLEKICNDSYYKLVGGIKKEYFFYAAYKYFTSNEILKNYDVSNDVKENYKKLKNLEMIDFEALNKFYNYDNGVNKIKLNQELEIEILKNLPKNFNKIQSAIYIYIKMCKLLSYDEEFFFAHKEAKVLEKHKYIEHLLSVSPRTNEVVCYEFNAIYAKLLKDLGISFTPNRSIEECYGTNSHMMLDFRCGKYLVSADSLTSIFNGDIINAKINQKITGLKCENKNEKTREDFDKLLNSVYSVVIGEEEPKKYYMRDFDDSNIIDKLKVLIDTINCRGLLGIDLIAYILKLYKILYNEKERMENIKASVITDYNGKIHGGVVFCVNTDGFNVGEENTYYLIDTRRNISVLNRIEIQELFDNMDIDYFDELRYELPGIKKVLKN